MNKPEMIELLKRIENFYPGRFKSDDYTASTWWKVLKDHDIKLCEKNLVKHVQVGEWPPSIANLIAGTQDKSRTYSHGLVESIESEKSYEELVADIQKRTGMRVRD